MSAAQYQIVIPRTRRIINTVPALSRAKEIALWHWKRMQHPKYPPEVVVERVGPDGRRRRVWAVEPVAPAPDELAIPAMPTAQPIPA